MTDSITNSTEKPPTKRGRSFLRVVIILAVVAGTGWYISHRKPPLVIPEGGGVSDWPAYGRDAGGARYAPLTQITPGNVMHLEEAWVYRTGDDLTGTPAGRQAAFEATPILIDGTLYLSTQINRVIALDSETGAEKWVFDPKLDFESGGFSEFTSRGVSTWKDPETGRRMIYHTTLDARLFALDAETGQLVTTFGDNGKIDLSKGVGEIKARGHYLVTSPPAVIDGLVITGSAVGDNGWVDSERGVVRAFDARTGKERWSWDPIPREPSDPGWDTWEPEQAKITGGANAWSILAADEERGLVFIPTGSASPDYYGGERKGDNLYANCVVALRAATGEVVWHFQVVHHDLWDYDVPAQPVLIDVTIDGEKIPAVCQATKMGHVFFLHRETGEPLFPVEERPVPQTDVPGEQTAATQPFPVITPALVPHNLKPEDAWGLTPWDKGKVRERLETLRADGLFTPPSLQGSLHYPGVAGGTNWGGVAFDPVRELVIMNTSRVAFVVTLRPRDEFEQEGRIPNVEQGSMRGTPYGMHREPLLSPWGLPGNPPPWGTLTAISTRTGEQVWESVLGTVRDLAPIPIPVKWGTPTMGGPIVTESGLTFIAATMDDYLRAFDTDSGKELWKGRLPAGGQATPMTYRLQEDGKQYVVICAGGHGRLGTKLGDYVIAYALPDK
jgi:quinoprotein glucose dehydrogenase